MFGCKNCFPKDFEKVLIELQKENELHKRHWDEEQDYILREYGPDTTTAGLIKMLVMNEKRKHGDKAKTHFRMADIESRLEYLNVEH